MWKYERVKIENSSIHKIMEELNTYGNDGWEIIYYNEIKPNKFGSKFTVITILKKNIL